MSNLTPEDWSRAEAHLRQLRDKYTRHIEQSGVIPVIGLDEIVAVEARFQLGERTWQLYEEIMALS